MKKEIVRLWKLSAVNRYKEKIKDISLLIRENECHLLWGRDYSGRTLAGIFKTEADITAGELYIRNVSRPRYNRELLEKQKIYYIDGDTEFMESLDLAENLFLLKKNSLKKLWINETAIHIQTDTLLKKYGLTFEAGSRTDRLSASDKIILSLIRAAAGGAELLILNNISTACSKNDTAVMSKLLYSLKQEGMAFLIYDSHPENFTEIADCLLLMKQGEVIRKIWDPENFCSGFDGSSGELSAGCHRGCRDGVLKETDEGEIRWIIGAKSERRSSSIIDFKPAETEKADGEGLTIAVKQGEIIHVISEDAAKQGQLWRDMLGTGNRKALLEIDGKRIAYRHAGELLKERIAFWGDGKEHSEVFTNLPVKDNILLPSLRRISTCGFYQKAAGFVFHDKLIAGEDDIVKESEYIQQKENWSESEVLKITFYKWNLFHPRLLVVNNILSGADKEMKEWLIRQLKRLSQRGTAVILLEMSERDVKTLADRAVGGRKQI